MMYILDFRALCDEIMVLSKAKESYYVWTFVLYVMGLEFCCF